jgi:hypothetical protein
MTRRPHAPSTPLACLLGGLPLALPAAIAGAAIDTAPRSPNATHELIDTTLGSRTIRLLGWDDTTVTIIDEDGLRTGEPIAGVLAVRRTDQTLPRWRRPSPDALAGGTAVVVELTDGQRLIGSVGPWDSEELAREARDAIRGVTDDDAFAVLAPTPVLDPLAINDDGSLAEGPITADYRQTTIDAVPLGAVRRVLFDPWSTGLIANQYDEPTAATDADAIVDDELVFINGDRLSGFVISIDETVRFDTGQGEREFATDRLAELRLGNPARSSEYPRLWYTNGEIRDGLFPRSSETEDPSASSDAVIAGWFTDRERIPLADLEIRGAEPGPGRRWTHEPKSGSAWASPLGVADIELAGPMTVEWRLPPQAASFSAIAALGGTIDRPNAAPGPWADAIVRVSVRSDTIADTENTPSLVSVPLNAGNRQIPISCDLPGEGDPNRTLVIEVLEAAHGPIQDRVLLRRPFLLGR